jgi:hypothetical protein
MIRRSNEGVANYSRGQTRDLLTGVTNWMQDGSQRGYGLDSSVRRCVFTSVKASTMILWVVTPYSLVDGTCVLDECPACTFRIYNPEDDGSMFLRYIGTHLQDLTVSQRGVPPSRGSVSCTQR